jgi:hypothetical protein
MSAAHCETQELQGQLTGAKGRLSWARGQGMRVAHRRFVLDLYFLHNLAMQQISCFLKNKQ